MFKFYQNPMKKNNFQILISVWAHINLQDAC